MKKLLNFWSEHDGEAVEALFEHAPVMMHSIDAQGYLRQVSNFWAETLGYAPEEMIGRKSVEFLSETSKAYAAEVLKEFYKSGKIYNISYEFVAKDGHIVPVLMSAIAQLNDKGEFVRSLAIMFYDPREAQNVSSLANESRLAALGRLVGGVAHDFNNILYILLGNLELASMYSDDPDFIEAISDAKKAVERGQRRTMSLLSFGQQSPLQEDRLDVIAAVDEIADQFGTLFLGGISVRVRHLTELPHVQLDKRLLAEALLNLISNARDAMPNGGDAFVTTRYIDLRTEHLRVDETDILQGPYVVVAVKDTGIGMDERTQARVFEPYFTTKPVGKGTGLGMSMVHGFVKQSHGFMRLHSTPGAGTEVEMYFPAIEALPESVATASEPGENPTSSDTPIILVVEDETAVQRVLKNQLASQGYRVEVASNADEAFDVVSQGLRPQLVITDVIMPGSMKGPATAEKLAQDLPETRFLFISGHTQDELSTVNCPDADNFLPKPILRNDLLAKVRELT